MDDKRFRLRLNGIANILFLAGMLGVTVAVIGAFFTAEYTWQFRTFVGAIALLVWGVMFAVVARSPLRDAAD